MKTNNSITVPLSMAGAAALLSFVTGFISGVGTVQIILRGIFSAVLAGGFVFFAAWLIRTFLPELMNLSDKEESAEDEPAGGSRVNIVMPDEMPSPAAVHTAGSSVSAQTMTAGDDEAVGTENKIAENSETVHNNKLKDSDPDRATGPGNLDILPDLDSLEISVGGVSGSSEPEGAVDTVDIVKPSAPVAAAPASGDYGDPEDIAKAIKTVVARDQHK